MADDQLVTAMKSDLKNQEQAIKTSVTASNSAAFNQTINIPGVKAPIQHLGLRQRFILWHDSLCAKIKSFF